MRKITLMFFLSKRNVIFYMNISHLYNELLIMIIAMIISLITLVFPLIMTLIALLALLLFPCYLTIRQILKFVATKGQNISYLLTGLLSLVGLIVIIFMIAKRKDKIKNLPTFLKISTLVIKSQMCSVFAQLIIFSIIEVGIWVLFSNLFFAVASIDNSNFINFLTKAVVLLVWIFTNGFFISLSDYFIQALAIYWFYSHSNPQIQQHQFKSIQDNLQQNEFSNQQKIDSHKVNFEIYNSLKRHIGTVMFGALLAYIPTYFIAKIHKLLIKSSSKQYFFVTFSKYCFVETILEEMNFNQANQRTFQLRKRIKTTMPQLYMLGHFYGDIIKLCLCIIGIILLSEFTDDFLGLSYIKKYFWSYTFTVVAFGFGLGLQIATNFANIIGMCGDVAFIMYCIDLQIQRVHYGKNCNYSTPIQLMEILKQLTIKRKWNQ